MTKKATDSMKLLELKLSGTSPLSFEVSVGTTLQIKEVGPSNHWRPTVGSGFKSNGLLVFNNKTKVGSFKPEDMSSFSPSIIPATCTVTEVDKSRKILRVALDVTK